MEGYKKNPIAFGSYGISNYKSFCLCLAAAHYNLFVFDRLGTIHDTEEINSGMNSGL